MAKGVEVNTILTVGFHEVSAGLIDMTAKVHNLGRVVYDANTVEELPTPLDTCVEELGIDVAVINANRIRKNGPEFVVRLHEAGINCVITTGDPRPDWGDVLIWSQNRELTVYRALEILRDEKLESANQPPR